MTEDRGVMLSRDEFRDTMARLYQTTDAGLRAIADEVKEVGARLTAGDVARENLRLRLETIEGQLKAAQVRQQRVDDDGAPRSRLRTATLASLGLTLLVVTLKLLFLGGEFALEILKTLLVKGR